MLSGSQKNTLPILLALSTLIVLARWYGFDQPLYVDIPLYSLIAEGMLNGKHLYLELWDHKPPAIYIVYAIVQWLVGFGDPAVFLIATLTTIITLFGVYTVASRWGRDPATGLWAAACWTFVSGDLLLQAQKPNGEAFMNACMIWSLALYLKPGDWNTLWKGSLPQGILFFLASSFKPFTVVFSAFLSLAHIVWPPEGKSTRSARINQVLVMIVMGIGFWSATLLYFFLQGRFDPFWEAVVVYNQFYAGDILANLKQGFRPGNLIPTEMKNCYSLVAAFLVGILFSGKIFSPRERALYLAYAFSVLLMIALPGQFFGHYYQLWLPLLCVVGIQSLVRLMEIFKPDRPSFSHGAALGLILIVAGTQLPAFFLSTDEWAQISYDKKVHYKRTAGKILKNILQPGERMFVWGWDPDLYYVTRAKTVSRFLIVLPLDTGPFRKQFSEILLKELNDSKPELLVMSPWRPESHPLVKKIILGYVPFPHSELLKPYEFYYLKGSALGKRLLAR